MQNAAEAQETSERASVPGGAVVTATGADQVPDTSLRAYPDASMAVQNDVVGQDSARILWLASMTCGVAHVEPL